MVEIFGVGILWDWQEKFYLNPVWVDWNQRELAVFMKGY